MNGQAAPGNLELVRGFVNTLDVETGADRLASEADLAAWLEESRLVEGRVRVTHAHVRRAVELREALRMLLLANNGLRVDPGAASVLDGVSRRAGIALRFTAVGVAELEPTVTGVDGALGRLLAIVAGAMADGTWTRLKACRAEACRWAYYDRARNRSRAWCSMAVCGNRAKAREYRRRQSTAGALTL